MTESTRDRIIATSIALMTVQGFNHTGIAEILSRAKVPKGSFYHYFPSKEALGHAIIDHYGDDLRAGLACVLHSGKGTPLTRLRTYFEGALGYFAHDFALCNCLLGNLAQELALQNEGMRQTIDRHYRRIEQLLGECLLAAQQAGEVAPDLDTASLARLFFSSWEGCLVRAKLEGSPAPLQELLALYFDKLLPP